jgi:predicted amidohydrolase
MSFKAAAVQMRSGTDVARNVASMERLVRSAAAGGATYVQTPEMTGLLQKDRELLRQSLRSEADDLVIAAASKLARDLSIHLHVGSTAIARDDGRIANRGFLFAPDGERICSYDKIHMFDVDLDNGETYRESSAYEAGAEAKVAHLPFASLGFAICYDLRFPQLFRAEALAGANVLTIPASFTVQTGQSHWEVLMRARAIENGAFVIAAAQGGTHEDGRHTFGHSIIVDPWGKVLAMAGGIGEEIIYADIDPSLSAAARGKVPNLKNAREFELGVINARPAEHGV